MALSFIFAYLESQSPYSGISLENVTRVGITGYDSNLLVEMNNDGRIYEIFTASDSNAAISNLRTAPATTFEGGTLARLDTNVTDRVSYALTEDGKIYGISALNYRGQATLGEDRYGMFGVLNPNAIEEQNDAGTDSKVIAPSIRPTRNGAPLEGYLDVLSGKRSVCAIVSRLDDHGEKTPFTDTYCWGSSTFGQLGFNDGIGGFSFFDAIRAEEHRPGCQPHLRCGSQSGYRTNEG